MFKKIKEFFSGIEIENLSHLPLEAVGSSSGAWGFATGMAIPYHGVTMSEAAPAEGNNPPTEEKKEVPEEKTGNVVEPVPVRTSRLPITAAPNFTKSR